MLNGGVCVLVLRAMQVECEKKRERKMLKEEESFACVYVFFSVCMHDSHKKKKKKKEKEKWTSYPWLWWRVSCRG